MRSKSLLGLAVLATVGWSGAAWAADANTPAGQTGRAGQRAAMRARLLEKFDTNKDGKLDATERAAARKAIQQWRQNHAAAGGAGAAAGAGPRAGGAAGAGAAGNGGLRAMLLKKFDANGDGKLDATELAAAKKAIQQVLQKLSGQAGSMRQWLLKKFDTNGDGKLDATEKAAAKKAIQEWRSKHQAGAGAGAGAAGAAGAAATN